MARLRVPAIAVGLLLFIGAGVVGWIAFLLAGGAAVGLAWAVMVFLGVLVAWLVVSVVRARNESRAEQP
jgi:Flp pilus assembly protein TadB